MTDELADGRAGGEQRSPSGSRWHLVVSLLITLAVVAGEFALLTAVYFRAQPVRAQRVAQASFVGALHTFVGERAAPGSGTSGTDLVAATETGIAGLQAAGVSSAELAPIRASAQRVVAEPTSTPVRIALWRSVSDLGTRLAARQHRLDREAELSYIALLVAASSGWAWWFRKLVRRHRALERAFTAERSEAAGQRRLAALISHGRDVALVLDADSTAMFVSPSAHTVLGHEPARLLGARFVDVIDAGDAEFLTSVLGALRSGAEQQVRLRIAGVRGDTRVLEGVVVNLLGEPSVEGFVLTLRDVTEKHELEQRLSHQAFHDELTGLANRRLFSDRLAHALRRRNRDGEPLVVLYCDLDDFKDTNDRHGHAVGDALLAAVGQRLTAYTRNSDTAARLGGDEFALLLENTELETAVRLAERIRVALTEPVVVDGDVFSVDASIGIAAAAGGDCSGDEILRNADVAMYVAKDRGKSTIAVYDASQHEEAIRRLELRADLQRALRDDEFVLHFQPTLDLRTGEIGGYEALVRWRHPERGLLPPLDFIPLAERSGLIVPLGRWVLFEACRAAVALEHDSRRPSIAVNVAALQLRDDAFVSDVREAVTLAGLATNRLVLEITESAVVDDMSTLGPKLDELRSMGIQIAIDDFGTGYSSLSYLTQLPLDVLKVDKSFIDRVTEDAQDASVAETILALSSTMGLRTVAEGVETARQATWLKAAGCDFGQGFLWSRPVDLEAARRLLVVNEAEIQARKADQELLQRALDAARHA